MRALVVFGSKRGGTAGLATAVAQGLAQAGHEVDVLRADDAVDDDLEAWDAVVVGGALYAGRWHRHARQFVHSHVDELRQMPVFFFSSGPLDDSAAGGKLPPTRQVARLMRRVGARGHVTFGGRLQLTDSGFVARALVKQGRVGDWRRVDAARDWGRTLGHALAAMHAAAPTRLAAASPTRTSTHSGWIVRRVLAGLCLFTGITAVFGGFELMVYPQGPPWAVGLTPDLLVRGPFVDFFVPGLLLLAVIGVGHLVAGVLVLRRRRFGELVAIAAGAALTVWLVTQLVMLAALSWLHLFYFALALAIGIMALRLWLRRRAILRRRAALLGIV